MTKDYPPVDGKGLTTPFGTLRYAEDYRQAAELVHRDGSLLGPAYMLIGHCYELALKAYLLARGQGIEELSRKPYGHNLVGLWEEASRLRIDRLFALSQIAGEVLQTLNLHYQSHEFRYIKTGTKTVPHWEFAAQTAKSLTHSLHDYCLRKRVGKEAALKRLAPRGKF